MFENILWIAGYRHNTVINRMEGCSPYSDTASPSEWARGRRFRQSGDKKMLGFGGNEIARTNDNKEQAADTPVMFETFEARILTSGSCAAFLPESMPPSISNQVIVQGADRGHTEGGPGITAN